MMAKSEIALLAITVLGTLAAGLAGQHPGGRIVRAPDLRPAKYCVQRSSERIPWRQAVLRRRESIVRSSTADILCVSVTGGYVRRPCQALGGELWSQDAPQIGRVIAGYLEKPVQGYEPFTPSDPAGLRKSLKPGDVLLVEGNSHISRVIKYLTQSTWSHAALYVGPIESANTMTASRTS